MTLPSVVAVCGVHQVRKTVARHDATVLVSLFDPHKPMSRPHRINREHHLQLEMEDITDPGDPAAPQPQHVERAHAFVGKLDPASRVVVHCMAGISRSTAMALGLRAVDHPPDDAMDWLLSLQPHAQPNPLLVRLWDEHLNLKGQLVAAVSRSRGHRLSAGHPQPLGVGV